MLRRVKITLFGLLACHVAACSPLSVEDRVATCVQTDWQRFGENDGRLGIATSERSDQFQDCAKLGRPANISAYQTGRAHGLESYCTAENGYRVGYEGRDYDDVCPTALETGFLQGFNRGRRERPSYAIWPSIAIGIGTGGGRTGVGVGVGFFSGSFGYGGYGRRHCTVDRYCW